MEGQSVPEAKYSNRTSEEQSGPEVCVLACENNVIKSCQNNEDGIEGTC